MEKVVQDFYDLFMEYYKKFVESPFEMFLAAVKILTYFRRIILFEIDLASVQIISDIKTCPL